MVTHTQLKASLAAITVLVAGFALTATPVQAAGGSENITSFDGTTITFNWCTPEGTGSWPVIINSHGWGGSKSGCSSSWTDAGYAYVSVSARGFGGSGGQANVHDPDLEGRDFIAMLDWIGQQDWALDETDGDSVCGDNDFVAGATGGSYGGGFQFLMAFAEMSGEYGTPAGCTRMDALAPDITWHDLPTSLAPNNVVRSAWVAALFAAGSYALPFYIQEAAVYTFATGMPPNGEIPGTPDILTEFGQHGPSHWVAQGLQLDIPVLITQGLPDNLFILNEGYHNFEWALTDAARAQSTLVGHMGGHALPNAAPLGYFGGAGSCSVSTRDFYDLHLKGVGDGIETGVRLPASGGDCVAGNALGDTTEFPLDLPVATTTMAGAVQHIPVASGPMTVAGIPELTATMTSAAADTRAFVGISKGRTPADAQVLSNNLMPIRSLLPSVLQDLDTELSGIAVDVAEGENLYLTVTPFSDMFATHGSRAPGAIVLTDAVVHLPVVE